MDKRSPFRQTGCTCRPDEGNLLKKTAPLSVVPFRVWPNSSKVRAGMSGVSPKRANKSLRATGYCIILNGTVTGLRVETVNIALKALL